MKVPPGRWKIALALAGIFIAGAAAGGIAGYTWAPRDPRGLMRPNDYTERYLQRMITEVKLTTEQVECLRPMMEEFSEKLSVMRQKAFAEARDVIREMDRRIEADLTPEQRELYHQMKERERQGWGRGGSPKPRGEEKKDEPPIEDVPPPGPPPPPPPSMQETE
jgi:Spy/CpxP family protein refolding chaperone